MLIALAIAFAATRPARSAKVPATGDGTRWRTTGTTQVAGIGGGTCGDYTQALVLAEGANATLSFTGSRYSIDGVSMPGGGDVWISVDNGPNLVFGTSADTTTCQAYADVSVDPFKQHQLRVFVPDDQDGNVFFALLGVDITDAADETIITDPNPPPGTSTTATSTSTRSPIAPSSSNTITEPGSTVSSPTPSTTNPAEAGGISKGAIVGIGITIPALLALLGVFAFWFWRRRRDARQTRVTADSSVKPYGVSGGAAAPAGDTKSPALLRNGDTKGEPQPFFPPADSTDPSSGTPYTITTNKEALRALYTSSADKSPRVLPPLPPSSSSHAHLPPGAAAPSTSSHRTDTASPTSQGGSSPAATGDTAPAEPAMQELYQAMNAAGFTVNTLFDRLRRSESGYQPRGRRRNGGSVATVIAPPQSEVLPRYE